MVKLFVAILVGKLIYFLSQKFNIGGGSAAPGLYALKVDPDLVKKLSSRVPNHIVITGTNGKTTTSRLLGHFAKAEGIKVIRNNTGSNLERGIASSLVSNVSLFGGFGRTQLGIWELDEAAFNSVAPLINPSIAIFLNVFRDQLDRYGEIDTVLRKWQVTLGKLNPSCKLVLNGDDQNIAKLDKAFSGKSITFGLSSHKITGESKEAAKKTDLGFDARNIKLDKLDSSKFQLSVDGIKEEITLPLPGIYHIYDFLAAFVGGINLGFSGRGMIESLKNYSPAFGRFEKIDLDERSAYLFLIKNPFGATQVLKTITPYLNKDSRLLIALNDNFADGTDVSWIWDTDFEAISHTPSAINIICSGTRAYDLALRLKYAGINTDHIEVETSLEDAFKASKGGLKGDLFILPTYTALLSLQAILTEGGHKGQYWREEN